MKSKWFPALIGAGALLNGLHGAAAFPVRHEKPIPRAERPVRPYLVQRGDVNETVSLTLDHTPIRDVLHLLFRRSDKSYVLGYGVRGTVSATLRDLPFPKALHAIMISNSVPLVSHLIKGVYVIKGKYVPKPQHRYGFKKKYYAKHYTLKSRFAPIK